MKPNSRCGVPGCPCGGKPKRTPKRDGVTRDGILWHIGAETIECRCNGVRHWYSGYTLREALAEFRLTGKGTNNG
jgi:hypothetical protein